MAAPQGYLARLTRHCLAVRLTVLEKVLVGAILAMVAVNMLGSILSKDVGNLDKVRMARLQAEQEQLALTPHR
ncbi:MAG: hypothetical protein AB7P76_06120 [Candidatus Melainabacteria bacterium]